MLQSVGLAELAQPYEFQMLPDLFWISGPLVTQTQRVTRDGSADSVLPTAQLCPVPLPADQDSAGFVSSSSILSSALHFSAGII